ncbi:hypothetical protein HRI_003019300 [Hibiscus trionum]|uniref:Uncharacterized protein n=1 Tax=Hibiscus trionum TaxID=183268 RepID=A0A9W7MCP5_HIBTR|nr:hypothetical protein HRI_003019300 [Hibiscus trionum]
MDASKKAMENFDSLWFFNNVLTLTTPFQHKQKFSIEEEEDTVEEEMKPPESMILHDVRAGSEILVPRCPNCGEIADVGTEQRRAVQPIQVAEMEYTKPERRKRGRRSKRKLDLGYYGSLDSESSFSDETNGLYYLKMPPLNDGFAMKEHLKSWAYAVACTVR